MSKRKKTIQDNSFDGSRITALPIPKKTEKRPSNVQELNEGSSSNAIFKRPRLITVPEETFLANFKVVMHDCITSKIASIVKNTKEGNLTKKLDDLKLKSLNDKKLPLGIIQDTAKASGCSPAVLRDYLEKHLPMKNNVAWNQYVEEHFDNILKTILAKNANINNQLKEQAPVRRIDQPENEYRTCSTSINKIIRNDLPPAIRSMLMINLQETMTKVSTYMANFSQIVFLTMILLKDGGLVFKNNKPSFDHSVKGLDFAKILPQGFAISTTQKLGPAPLSVSESIEEINNLFEETHLSLVHSHFFGSRGQLKGSKEKYLVYNSLFDSLASFGVGRDTYKEGIQQLSNVEMSIARNNYLTNLKTMWDKKKIFKSMLNHLLDVLLRVHLAPKREQNFREMKKAKEEIAIKKQQQSQEKTFSRNRMRNLVRAEYNKHVKYRLKSDERKINASLERIAFFKRKQHEYSVSRQSSSVCITTTL